MKEVSINLIEKAVYQMCYEANLILPQEVYEKIEQSANFDKQNEFILKNAQIAFEKKRPLCQDTGQVIVFVKVGCDVCLIGGNVKTAINKAISRCYKENYFRKSVVKDALKNRENTNNNTPCVTHFDYVDGDEIEIKILIKGGGSENVTASKMLNPTSSKTQIYQEILDILKFADRNACPPVFVGVGLGQTLDNAVMLSKKAIIDGETDNELCEFLNNNFKIGLKKPVLDVKILTNSTHIASMPLGVTIMCHSNRYHSCKIKNNEIFYTTKLQEPKNIEPIFEGRKISVDDLLGKNKVKSGEKVLFSGIILTARDAAHKKLTQMIKNGENLPINLENSIIFYAGPCPKMPNEISAPIGPTTAKRMDNFASDLYKNGVIATIAKGQRATSLLEYLKKNNKKYFELQGGIASYIANCVKSSQIMAFEELGAEAIYKLEVENLPLTCVI
ncbi:fumarate hydratase [bacterium]|nr:fumarate hydratase [bacterium]